MALWGQEGSARQHYGHPCRASRSMLPNWSISLSQGQKKHQLQRYQQAGTHQPRGFKGLSLLVAGGTLGGDRHPYPTLRSPEALWG